MNKKILSLVFVLILISPLISATDIAYITKTPRDIDATIMNILNELNYSVRFINDANVSRTNFNLYKTIIVPNVKFDSYNYIPVNNVNTIFLNTYHLKDWHWIQDGASQIASNQPLRVNVVNSSTRITKNLPRNFQVYTQAKYNGASIPMYFLSRYKIATKINKIVSIESNPLDSVIAMTKPGTPLRDGYTSNARSVFFGITETEYWTENTKKLFKNSLLWVVEGEDVNKAPVLNSPIPDIEWISGGFAQIDLNNYFSDPNGDRLIYGINATSNDRNITIALNSSIATFTSAVGWGGEDWVIFYASDGQFKTISNNVTLRVDAGIYKSDVRLLNPINNSVFNNREVRFEFTARNNFAENLTCNLYLNDIAKETTIIQNNGVGNFSLNSFSDGLYFWNVKCYNGFSYSFAPQNYYFQISAPDAPRFNMIGNKVVNENSLLQFNVYATDSDRDSMILKVSGLPSRAEFNDLGNGTGKFSWTPTFNQSGIYNLIFSVEDSTGLNYSENVKITVNNVKEPPKFSDVKLCENITPELDLKIKEPDEGDDFTIGEKINTEIKIKNNAKEDMKVKWKIYLYDLDEDEEIENSKGSVKVKERKSETIETELQVPDDASSNEYAVLVVAEADEELEYCNYKYININIERNEHEVIIDKMSISPQSVEQGGLFELILDLLNIGEEDEDVYVEIKNSQLGISEKSGEFEIENFEDNNDETKKFSLSVPSNAVPGIYEIEAAVFYDDGNEKFIKTETIGVSKKEEKIIQPKSGDLIKLNPAIPKEVINLKPSAKSGAIVLQEDKTFKDNNIKLTTSVKKTERKTFAEGDVELRVDISEGESENFKLNISEKKIKKGFWSNFLDHPLTLREYLTSINIFLIAGIFLILITLIVILRRK